HGSPAQMTLSGNLEFAPSGFGHAGKAGSWRGGPSRGRGSTGPAPVSPGQIGGTSRGLRETPPTPPPPFPPTTPNHGTTRLPPRSGASLLGSTYPLIGPGKVESTTHLQGLTVTPRIKGTPAGWGNGASPAPEDPPGPLSPARPATPCRPGPGQALAPRTGYDP